MTTGERTISNEELATHTPTSSSVWIAIRGSVYDVTHFLSSHPGGASVIKNVAGTDATAAFEMAHAIPLDSLPEGVTKVGITAIPYVAPKSTAAPQLPVAEEVMITPIDFVPAAQRRMAANGWIYYATAAEDEHTLRRNKDIFNAFLFCPRVCVDVSNVRMDTVILGVKSSLPLFVGGAALQGLAYSGAEVTMCKAAHRAGVPQLVPHFSSKSLDDIAAARAEGQPLFFQLYMHPDRAKAEAMLKRIVALGFHAVFLTVDAPQLGRRERDLRQKYAGHLPAAYQAASTKREAGVATALNSFIAQDLTWKDVTWIKGILGRVKLVLKGVQRADDAVRAVELGCDGLLLSNHGGRQLDTCRTGVEVLIEVTAELRRRNLLDKIELFVDGGVWRGRDIAKCLALGARAVGVAKAPIFAMAAGGEDAVVHCLSMFRDELRNTMALLGATNTSEVSADMVTRDTFLSRL